MILYEEREATERILFRIAENAMKSGMKVIYTTHDDDVDEIRERMGHLGSTVPEEREPLHIIKITDPMNHPRGPIEGTKELQNILFSQAKPPFLIISTLIPEIQSDEHADVVSLIEERCHRNFGSDCSLVCSYDMNRASHAGRHRWLVNMLQSHHDVLFVPKAKQPKAIKMR